MRFATIQTDAGAGVGIATADGGVIGLREGDPAYPGGLLTAAALAPADLCCYADALRNGSVFAANEFRFLPVIPKPGKILCVGLNYCDHAAESKSAAPSYPVIFARFATSLIGHGAPMLRPSISDCLDYEGELAVVIGRGGKAIERADALSHVFGYSVFNDASIRDFQLRTPQWTIGKNFDGTGAFGPWLTVADALPPGGRDLELRTRLNGEVVQKANTSQMIFDVAELISTVSAAMTLESGDVIVTGTPAGVGIARNPPLYMRSGDVIEVEIEGIGVLANTVEDGVRPRA